MSYLDYFRSVPTIDTLQLADLLRHKHPEDLTLLDVRQPAEYAAGHLPGAKHVPLAELERRLPELDRNTTVVVYCAMGLRSRGAAALLGHQGFEAVFNLAGGIQAWQGTLAAGGPEAILGPFSGAGRPEEFVAMAWLLEDGSAGFYRQVSEQVRDSAAADLFRELAGAEDRHVATLEAVYEGLSGRRAEADFPLQVLPPDSPAPGELMEGGMRVAEALAWAKDQPVSAILDLAIGLETNALDRYLVLSRDLVDPNARRVFAILADEERRHLNRLIRLFEHHL